METNIEIIHLVRLLILSLSLIASWLYVYIIIRPKLDRLPNDKILLWYGRKNRKYIILKH